MVRKLIAVLIVVALALLGVQPRAPITMGSTASADAAMQMSGGMAMDMAAEGMAAGQPCCPDIDTAMNYPCCDMQRGPGCSFPCGAPAPVFVQALALLRPMARSYFDHLDP
jgi:hypothetical protein